MIFSILLGWGSTGFAQAANLEIEFEYEPTLFSTANFLPGDIETRWFKVTNFTTETRVLGLRAENTYDCSADPFCLADVLQMEIRNGATVLYMNSLRGFFNDGVVILDSLGGSGATATYDLEIYFPESIANEYQKLVTGFDLAVGFVGAEPNGSGTITTASLSNDGGSGTKKGLEIDIQKSGNASTPPGVTTEFILTVTNLGQATAPDVVINDVLPPGFTYLTGTWPGSIMTSNDIQTITWPVGDVNPFETVIIKYLVAVPMAAQGQYLNKSEVLVAGLAAPAGYYDADDFAFSVTQVLGYDYQDNSFVENISPPDTKVLGYTAGSGYDLLPVTGGEILGFFGLGDQAETMTLADNRRVRIFLFFVFTYFILLVGYLVFRFRQNALTKAKK